MKHRVVVANFLFRSSSGQTLVALFRRSTHPNVRSYQGKLAPVSGSIDKSDSDPLGAAVREIREETQLQINEDIELKFAGKPYSFTDNEAQRSWTVYPFAWDFKVDDSKIEIDWEHSAWEWVRPEQVLSGKLSSDCVPNLDTSLMRVYFGPGGMFPGASSLISEENEAGKIFLSTLKELRTDNVNGARVLAIRTLEGLSELLRAMNIDQKDQSIDITWWKTIRIAAYHFIYSGRPSMSAAIKAAILQAFRNATKEARSNLPQPQVLGQCIETLISNRNQASSRVAQAFANFLRDIIASKRTIRKINILTLSSSSTIRSSLLHFLNTSTDLSLNLTIFESRPLCEGVSLANTLLESVDGTAAQSRLHIAIAPDSHIAYMIQETLSHESNVPTIVLLGADRITPSGSVSNKTGSSVLAVLAKTLFPESSVVILSETDKIATPLNLGLAENDQQTEEQISEVQTAELGDINEVTKIWPILVSGKDVQSSLRSRSRAESVEIKNIYFELVHHRWIDTYICEDGLLKRENISLKSTELGEFEEIIFDDLYESLR